MEIGIRRKGLVLCLSGPSGVGKGTVIAALRRLDGNLDHSVSVTTRSPRPNERDGVEYYFRSREEFEAMLAAGEILEHDEYCGCYYGTPLRPLQEKTALGRDVIMDITVPGSLVTLERFPEAVSIFLLPPSLTELRRRLEGRGTETAEAIDARLAVAREEILEAPRFTYNVVNHDVGRAVECIRAIMAAERARSERLAGIAEAILNR
ncbi:MAG: guanylate kinase [Bacillota bacterium]|nr:guanylate kinase [Bacillota bacterium]